MINPVDFDSFFKIVGGVGILSLISQVTSFFKTIDDMKSTKKAIEEKRKHDTYDQSKLRNFPKHIENDLAKISDINLKKYFLNFIAIVLFSLLSIVCYAIAKNIEVLSQSKEYLQFISIISYVFLTSIPIYFVAIVYRLFSLYFRLIEYKNCEDLYNHTK